MKKILLGSVATGALVAAGSANAADLSLRPAPRVAPAVAPIPVFSWTGCYVGGHAGWGWGRKEFHEVVTRSGTGGPVGLVNGSETIDTSGAIFGGQIGCDYQFAGNFVVGIQGSAAGAFLQGKGFELAGPGDRGDFIQVRTNWIADVTGRLGFTGWLPRTLIYVKGGGAWIDETIDFASSSSSFGGSFRQTLAGWTIGGGVEWAFAPNWSVFAEFQHYDFKGKGVSSFVTSNTGFGPASGTLDVTKERIETVKLGINYRFNWLFGKAPAPVVARY